MKIKEMAVEIAKAAVFMVAICAAFLLMTATLMGMLEIQSRYFAYRSEKNLEDEMLFERQLDVIYPRTNVPLEVGGCQCDNTPNPCIITQ